jgi:hypothetical protein
LALRMRLVRGQAASADTAGSVRGIHMGKPVAERTVVLAPSTCQCDGRGDSRESRV